MLMSKYLLAAFLLPFQTWTWEFLFWHEQGMKMYSVARYLKWGTFGIWTIQFSGFRSANSLVVALKPSLGAANQSHNYSKPYTLKPRPTQILTQITPQKNMQKHCTNMSFGYHLHTFCVLEADLLRSVCMSFANVCVFFAYALHIFFFLILNMFLLQTFFGDNLDQYLGLGPAFEHRAVSTATLWPKVEGLGGNP